MLPYQGAFSIGCMLSVVFIKTHGNALFSLIYIRQTKTFTDLQFPCRLLTLTTCGLKGRSFRGERGNSSHREISQQLLTLPYVHGHLSGAINACTIVLSVVRSASSFSSIWSITKCFLHFDPLAYLFKRSMPMPSHLTLRATMHCFAFSWAYHGSLSAWSLASHRALLKDPYVI